MKNNTLAGISLWIKRVLREEKFSQIRAVIWFILITLAIHYSYRFWAIHLNYWPVQAWMAGLHQHMTDWVLNQSIWVNQHILRISIRIEDHTMWFNNGSGIIINGGCSGDKQILQFTLLMLLYPGPWKHKLWFIPMGILIVHATNILRVVLMSVTAVLEPNYMQTVHDTALRAMFYIVIFGLWIIWQEKIRVRQEVIEMKK